MEITPRQEEILNSVIEVHIETAMPVGSAHLRERCRMRYSSATVRNEMGILEDAGLLTHTHISSGRIPTDMGYRYYVDHCMPQAEGEKRDTDSIEEDLSELSREAAQPETFVEEASRLLASVLRETSLVFLGDPRNIPERIRVFLQGSSHILEKPEFQDITKVRSLFQVFEEKIKLLELIEDHDSSSADLTIRIGQENHLKVFHECTVISTRYYVHGDNAGRIAVVGPKRMHYKEAVALVSRASEMIGDILDQRF